MPCRLVLDIFLRLPARKFPFLRQRLHVTCPWLAATCYRVLLKSSRPVGSNVKTQFFHSVLFFFLLLEGQHQPACKRSVQAYNSLALARLTDSFIFPRRGRQSRPTAGASWPRHNL